jgi:hypothetical protein
MFYQKNAIKIDRKYFYIVFMFNISSKCLINMTRLKGQRHMKIYSHKIKRELLRVRDQLEAAVRYPFEPLAQRWHDHHFAARTRKTSGVQIAGAKIAIYLIYQPHALSESTISTCAHLTEAGYAVLLVSNAPLRPNDRARLVGETWRIVERPNFGYDFGGYRDGLRIVREAGLSPDALVMLNDSIWWPVYQSDTTLEQMETIGADIVGMIYHRPRKRRDDAHRRFLHSYFYWFSKKALRSSAFHKFWGTYRVSSFKYNAIRRGELGITQALVAGGLTADALFSQETLIMALHMRDDDYLINVLAHATFKTPKLQHRAEQLMANSDRNTSWRSSVFILFDDMFEQSEFQVALMLPCFDMLNLNYLKKSPSEPPTSQYYRMRNEFLACVDSMLLKKPHSEVLNEIRHRQETGASAVGR